MEPIYNRELTDADNPGYLFMYTSASINLVQDKSFLPSDEYFMLKKVFLEGNHIFRCYSEVGKSVTSTQVGF